MKSVLEVLQPAHARFSARFPGDGGRRQPIHVIYGGAHLFRAETPQKLGQLALQALRIYAPDPMSLAAALGLPSAVADKVHARVIAKLSREPVEDFRIDFEDGYGYRGDQAEDAHAREAAAHCLRAQQEDKFPPFIGIRIKPLSPDLSARALRTLDLFVSTVAATSREAAQRLLITLPKVQYPEQVSALAQALGQLESRLGLTQSLRIEVMIESAPGLWDERGSSLLPQLRQVAGRRLFGAHLGAYDYTASLDIVASAQRLQHPACDALRTQMKWAFAGTEVFLSDGATTLMPVAVHRGETLTDVQRAENRRVVHAAWATSAADIRHALGQGFYQGWDLHPAQLVARYGTVFAFFLEHLEGATVRLRNFIDTLGQARLSGEAFDDAATGHGLLNFFLRGYSCGALDETEVTATGLSLDELRSRSFQRMVEARRKQVDPP